MTVRLWRLAETVCNAFVSPVTPEVAGSSPVAPVYEVPAHHRDRPRNMPAVVYGNFSHPQSGWNFGHGRQPKRNQVRAGRQASEGAHGAPSLTGSQPRSCPASLPCTGRATVASTQFATFVPSVAPSSQE